MSRGPLLLLCLFSQYYASPTAIPNANQIVVPQVVITPQPLVPTRTHDRRNVISDLVGDAESAVDSVLSKLGSAIPSYVASGVADFFQDLPSGTAVESSLGLNSKQIAAYPTQVLNIPPYANWTKNGWNVRFHGNVYKQPNITRSKLNDLANVFLVDTSVQSLPPSQADQARNLTQEIFVVQQGDVKPTFSLAPAPTAGGSGQPSGGGGVPATGGSQEVIYPLKTTGEGDFDAFVPIMTDGLLEGNATSEIQLLNVYTAGTDTGNATAYLVPPFGITIVSDIDDILRVTKIYEPSKGLLNTFARPFRPWLSMPVIYANWSAQLQNPHFHYLTTTPEQITRNYMQFIYSTYPGGSFDTRNLNFSDVSATLSIRKYLLDKVFETFPNRKFILVADTSNSDVMRDYPQMVTDYPGQVQCIFLRNTSATDPGDQFPYDTSGFKGIKQSMYMFFRTPEDLLNLDVANGHCYNKSVPQNVTFGYQGLPFGIGNGGGRLEVHGMLLLVTFVIGAVWVSG